MYVKIKPIHRERYLPTAFDGSLDLLEKMNVVIERTNEVSLSNEELKEEMTNLLTYIYGEEFKNEINEVVMKLVDDGVLNGVEGEKGEPFVIEGTLQSTNELPEIGEKGKGYIINGDLYVWK